MTEEYEKLFRKEYSEKKEEYAAMGAVDPKND